MTLDLLIHTLLALGASTRDVTRMISVSYVAFGPTLPYLRELCKTHFARKDIVMYLFFDVETTGLPKNWKAPIHDLKNWPRVVQIAWARYDAKDRHLGTRSFIVKPEGFNIPYEAQRIHGISTGKALTHGRPLNTVLKALATAFEEAKVVVAHNLRFDENVVSAEFLRQGLEIPFLDKKRVCTMIESTDYCHLPGRHGSYKWPTLAELHAALFGENLQESHDAEADVTACAKCFFELKRLRVLKVGTRRK